MKYLSKGHLEKDIKKVNKKIEKRKIKRILGRICSPIITYNDGSWNWMKNKYCWQAHPCEAARGSELGFSI